MAQLDYCDIEIRIDDPLAKSIREKIKKFTPIGSNQYSILKSRKENQCKIFHVPSHFRERNKNFYEPRIVSVGPYHRGRAHLKAMEGQKLLYVNKHLDENPNVRLEMYLKELRELEMRARRCYYKKFEMNSDEFVTMLLLDSVFIIQVAVNWMYKSDDDDVEDIVNDIRWNVPLIKSDLLMFENQIPFFVLEKVFELFSIGDEGFNCSSPSNSDMMSDQESDPEQASLFDVLVGFLECGNENFEVPGPNNSYDHLLHFYYERYVLQDFPIKHRRNSFLNKLKAKKVFLSLPSSLKWFRKKKDSRLIQYKRFSRRIPCATELKEAGIAFKRSESKSIFDVNFSGGVLKIPYILFEENTGPRIMNLIVFEQCSCRKQTRPLASYAVLMGCLIKKPRDALILQQGGIIENQQTDEGVAMFFDQVRYCAHLDYDEYRLAAVLGDVKKCCDSKRHKCKVKWQKYREKLCRDYFSSPWAIISFFAAILLLFLTATQSVYGVLGYYKQAN